jgi:hypothetical protein
MSGVDPAGLGSAPSPLRTAQGCRGERRRTSPRAWQAAPGPIGPLQAGRSGRTTSAGPGQPAEDAGPLPVLAGRVEHASGPCSPVGLPLAPCWRLTFSDQCWSRSVLHGPAGACRRSGRHGLVNAARSGQSCAALTWGYWSTIACSADLPSGLTPRCSNFPALTNDPDWSWRPVIRKQPPGEAR